MRFIPHSFRTPLTRWLYARRPATPAPAGGGAPEPAPAAGGARDIGEGMYKDVKNVPGLEKPGELVDVEGKKQSAQEIMRNLGTIQTKKEEELIAQYRDRYADLLGGEITPDVRNQIRDQELERFKKLAGASAQSQIDKILGPSQPKSYAEAIAKILDADMQSIDDNNTKELVEGLDNANLGKLQEALNKLKAAEQKKKDLEAQLKPLKDDLAKHKESLSSVEAVGDYWYKNPQWSWIDKGLKVATTVALGATAVGVLAGLGVGFASTGPASVGFWAAFKSVASFVPSTILSAAAAIPPAAGVSTVGAIGLTGMVYGALKSWPEAILQPGRFWHSNMAWIKERRVVTKKQDLKIDTDATAEIKAAEAEVAALKKDNEAKLADINGQISHYRGKQAQLTSKINSASPTEDVSALQEELQKTCEMIDALETVALTYSGVKEPEKMGLENGYDMESILSGIRKLKPDPSTRAKLETIAAQVDQENKKRQIDIGGSPYKEGVRKEMLEADTETLKDLKQFLNGGSFSKKLEKLKNIAQGKLYQTLKALEALPADNLYRKNTIDLLKATIESVKLDPQREAVKAALDRLEDQKVKDFVKGRPLALHAACRSSAQLSKPKTGQTFERWIKDLKPKELDLLLDDLEYLRTLGANLAIERDRLINKLDPLKKKIRKLFEDQPENVQEYINEDVNERLEVIAGKLQPPVTELPELEDGGSFDECVENTNNKEQLEKLKNLLAKMKGKIQMGANGEPELIGAPPTTTTTTTTPTPTPTVNAQQQAINIQALMTELSNVDTRLGELQLGIHEIDTRLGVGGLPTAVIARFTRARLTLDAEINLLAARRPQVVTQLSALGVNVP